NNIKFENLNLIYFSLILVLILFFLLRKRFVNEKNLLIKKKGIKRTIFFFRSIFFILLILALTNPYIELNEKNETITKLKILVDNSESMKLFDLSFLNTTLNNLNSSINIDYRNLDLKDYSSIGNSILNNIEPDENILLVTDGQNNFGISLNDVALFSNNINTKFFALDLKNSINENDYSVFIDGPDKVISNVENSFFVTINDLNKNKIDKQDEEKINMPLLRVYVDDNLIYEGYNNYELKKSFSNGFHVIKAELIFNKNNNVNNNNNNLNAKSNDLFNENNYYYKVIEVYEKPKILLISNEKNQYIEKIFDIYDVEIKQKLPLTYSELDKYYAIIFNDIESEKITNNDVYNLQEYVLNGNGLFVLGGKNSYDWGNYNNSLITKILPVSIGKANKKKDITNIVILFDSGVSATEELLPGISQFDVQKSMVADLIKSISNTNKVAIIEANYYLNTITGLSELGPKKAQVINEIGLLKPKGMSELRFAYKNAYDLLKITKGSKNIVIITDGLFRDDKFIQENKYALDQEVTLKLTEQAVQDNIKTFVIGVGEKADEKYLKALKEKGNGEYFKITENAKIKLYFGDPNENTEELRLFVYDSNHFITKDVAKDIKDLGKVYGFNSVYPKENARLLLTTSKGDPILTIWNYGLGRVASLTTYENWAPDLLKTENSKILVKTMNWLIENPERKNSIIIETPEIRANEDFEITIKTNNNKKEKNNNLELKINEIKSENINLYEIKKGIYKSNLYFNETGVFEILNKKIAVNYKKEYLNLGFNDKMENFVKITGGSLIEINENNYNEKSLKETIIEKIKTEGIIQTSKRKNIYYIFIIIAIIIYLIELFIRRLFDIKYSRMLSNK
ncbi:MAG: VWA domain-containing protein, partial [Candidatus Woesearchaeota archaeon]